MSPELVGLLAIIALLVLMALRMWVGLAMAVIGFVGLIFIQGLDRALLVVSTAPFTFIAKESFTVLPMFMLMGSVIGVTGIGTDLYKAAHTWIGHWRGGLAMATTLASAMFAAIVGSATAGVIVFGRVAYPEMKRFKYDDALNTGVICASATMGILIPPSVGFIIYGILTEQSVGKLFMAGVVPGVFQMLTYMLVIFIICRINPLKGPSGPHTTWKQKFFSIRYVWMMVALFLLVMGVIYTGVCTPTEAGAIGAFGACVITIVSRRLNLKGMKDALLDTGLLVGMMLMLLMATGIFQKFMAVSELPFYLGQAITGANVPHVVVMIFIVIVFFIGGMFLPGMLLIVLTVPILFPLSIAMGYDPIWFGVLLVILCEIGDISPPVGMVNFLMAGVAGVPVTVIIRGVIPFLIGDIVRIVAIMALPQLALWLPSLM